MTTDPRAALTTLVTALERHLEAAATRHGENDPVVAAAYRQVAEAFEDYDDALLDAFDEVTPLEVFRGDEDDDDSDDGGDDEEFDEPDDVEGARYTGLDDDDYDDEDVDDDAGPGSEPAKASTSAKLSGPAG